ncbi:MAG: type II secretion system protein [Vulcanimicrobiota bacterium]
MPFRRKAFTVAELIVAIGFLAVISVVVIGLFVRLTASSSKSADQSAALEVASRLLDEYARSTPEAWQGISSQQDLQTRDPGSKTTYYYRLRHRQIDDGKSLMGDLYRLDVDVFWWPSDSSKLNATPNRRDYGKLKVSLGRVVFVEHFRN